MRAWFISGTSCSSPTFLRLPSRCARVVPLRPNTRCAFAQPFSPILRGNATHSTWFDSSLPVASSRQKRGTIRHDSENESGAVEPMRPSTKYSVFSVRSCMPAEM